MEKEIFLRKHKEDFTDTYYMEDLFARKDPKAIRRQTWLLEEELAPLTLEMAMDVLDEIFELAYQKKEFFLVQFSPFAEPFEHFSEVCVNELIPEISNKDALEIARSKSRLQRIAYLYPNEEALYRALHKYLEQQKKEFPHFTYKYFENFLFD